MVDGKSYVIVATGITVDGEPYAEVFGPYSLAEGPDEIARRMELNSIQKGADLSFTATEIGTHSSYLEMVENDASTKSDISTTFGKKKG